MGPLSTRLLAAGILFVLPSGPAHSQTGFAQLNVQNEPVKSVSLEEYHEHLQQLQAVVQGCTAKRSMPACDPVQVGDNDEVSTPEGLRQVHYTWLRAALRQAGTPQKNTNPPPDSFPDPAQSLSDAAQRLAETQGTETAAGQTAAVRKNLQEILARHEFTRIEQPGLFDRAEAKAWEWILQRLTSVASFGSHNKWLVRVLEWLAITVQCVLLLWWLMVRRNRPDALATATEPLEMTAPSAREWRRWLQDAEAFAQAGRWREAVHDVYWATISRLESQGLWPADRARTPREYLRLLHARHTLLPDMRLLTRSFERIWYGHRTAEERQYQEARALMERLSVR